MAGGETQSRQILPGATHMYVANPPHVYVMIVTVGVNPEVVNAITVIAYQFKLESPVHRSDRACRPARAPPATHRDRSRLRPLPWTTRHDTHSRVSSAFKDY